MQNETPIMVGIPHATLDLESKEMLQKVAPMAVILFRRNCQSPQQVRQLTDELRQTLSADLLIAIDEEGGRVSRLDTFCTPTPAASALAAQNSSTFSVQAAKITARRLRMLGIDWNLAPVLDKSESAAAANALSGRCWGRNSNEILAGATPWLETFQKEQILSCIKHFPGSGRAKSDPHHNLPQVSASKEELDEDLLPFSALLDNVDSLMVGHIYYTAYSGKHKSTPASLEPQILTQLLRYRLDFRGVVLTDDLEMDAIGRNYGIGSAAQKAIEAGADMPLICHNLSNMIAAAETLRQKLDSNLRYDAIERIYQLQKRSRAIDALDLSRWQKLEQEAKQLHSKVSVSAPLPTSQNSSPVEEY